MNNQGMMMSRDANNAGGLIDKKAMINQEEMLRKQEEENVQNSVVVSSTMMMRRDMVPQNVQQARENLQISQNQKNVASIVEEKEISIEQPKTVGNTGKTKESVTDIIKQKQEAVKQQVSNASGEPVKTETKQAEAQPAKPVQPAQPAKQATAVAIMTPVTSIKSNLSLDELTKRYIDMFKEHFNIELSSSICFENMRKMCEVNVKDPDKTLYFLENTYRLSTLLYLTGNLPILIVTSIIAEKNRKNILKYVTIEVENGAKEYDEVKALRMKRWMNKYSNMQVNDAMTITPGVTNLTPELSALMQKQFDTICTKLKRFNNEMTSIVSKFDDATKNDVIYIYSNWWYLLQGFENVQEMRTYIMAITDDTRRNLKI